MVRAQEVPEEPPEKKRITDFRAIPLLFHKKKKKILEVLMKEELHILGLKERTGMNPGTIRRHLDDLIEFDLVQRTRTTESEYGQKIKLYRATGVKFVVDIHFEWP